MPKIRAAARAAGVPAFDVFGEVFETDAATLASFVRERGVPNVIDFPLQDALMRYAGGSAGARGIATRLGDDDYFRLGNGVAPAPVTFLGNHDVGRAALKIKEQGGGEGAELLARDLLGHSLLYLLRGAPAVYYGDEVGMLGRGGDKAARQDLFPTSVTEWQTEERVGSPPIGTGSSFDLVAHPVSEHLRALGALRDAHPALSTGASFVRVAREGTLVVSRIDRTERREYLAAFNASATPATVTVQTATPASSWRSLLGAGTASASLANGRTTVRIPPLSAALFLAESTLPRRGASARDGARRPRPLHESRPHRGDRDLRRSAQRDVRGQATGEEVDARRHATTERHTASSSIRATTGVGSPSRSSRWRERATARSPPPRWSR